MTKLALAVLLTTVTGLRAEVSFRHVILDPKGLAPAKPYGKAIGDISGDGKADAFAFSASSDGMHWYEYPSWKKHSIFKSGT